MLRPSGCVCKMAGARASDQITRMNGRSAPRLRRHFARVPGGYQINKTLRELCVFAAHDESERVLEAERRRPDEVPALLVFPRDVRAHGRRVRDGLLLEDRAGREAVHVGALFQWLGERGILGEVREDVEAEIEIQRPSRVW